MTPFALVLLYIKDFFREFQRKGKIPLDSRITVNVTHFFNKYVEENSMDSGQILMSPCVDITFVNVNCCSQTSSLDGNMKQ